MKTLTIEIPDDADEQKALYAAQRAVDPDWIAIWWHVDDVIARDGDEDSDLTPDECRKVLEFADDAHDAEEGINWSVLGYWIDEIKSERNAE
jgi:hypothetical protein